MRPRLAVVTVCAAVAADDTAPRTCNRAAMLECKSEYEVCTHLGGPAGEGYSELVCACSDEYYGACARRAGCASSLMTQCIAHTNQWGCDDASVCGSNCVGAGDEEIPTDARILPVNNYGHNTLKFSVCSRRHNQRALDRFGMVVMEFCQGDLFHECPYWIAPRTFTAIAIPQNASYIKIDFCVVETDGPDGEVTSHKCLDHPRPVEYHGTPTHWPSSIDVEFETAPYCQDSSDCPGSFCDTLRYPPLCSPKVLDQFQGPAIDFLKWGLD